MYIDNSDNSDNILGKLTLLQGNKVDCLLRDLSVIDKPRTIGFLNQHGYNLAVKDSGVADLFFSLDVLLRDGVGVEWACKLRGISPGENLNGTDFIPRLVSSLKLAWPDVELFAFGTQEPWLSSGAAKLFDADGVFSLDGFRSEFDYLDFVNIHSSPLSRRVIVLGMGMPKQEKVAAILRENLVGPALIICGGAVFDFYSGRFPRAPKFLRKLRLEWLYRLMKEPSRLFGRYVIGIPVFLFNVVVRSN